MRQRRHQRRRASLLNEGRIGVGQYHFNIANGTRQSVAHVLLGSIVNNIVGGNFTSTVTSGSTPVAATPAATQGKTPSTQIIVKDNTKVGSKIPRGFLKIQLGATVRKLLFEEGDASNSGMGIDSGGNGDGNDGTLRATGVEYEVDGKVVTAYLKRQSLQNSILSDFRSIILTAGALMTPKILMNSGIGPQEVLRSASIPVVVDSPMVGKGLQDHPVVGLMYRIQPQHLSRKALLGFLC